MIETLYDYDEFKKRAFPVSSWASELRRIFLYDLS